MPIQDIAAARTQRTADKLLDLDDAKAVLDAAGKGVSAKDLAEIKKTLHPTGDGYKVDPKAASWLKGQISQIASLQKQAKAVNAAVEKRAKTLSAEETAMLAPGVTKTYGGTVIPDAVKALVSQARKDGAAVYDVLQSKEAPSRDEHDPSQWTLQGVWSPYGVQDATPATGPMAFSYTELTPKAISDDMSTSRDQVVLTGTKQNTATDPRTGKPTTWETPTYEHKTMRGTGNVIEHYDEISHPEVFALMSEGEGYCKWDANFAVMADGTFHALPAMRRHPDEPNLILTDPSLGRDKRMMFNGHIEMQNGVVTSIALSGRLNKLAASGDAKFIDPVALLKAWGFQIAPNLQVGFEGGGGVHVDPSTNLIVKD